MMTVGMYQNVLIASGDGAPAWMIGGHAHLGVLSILAIVMGFAVDSLALSGTLRSAVTGLYVAGQWGLPGSIWVAEGFGLPVVHVTAFLWGLCLIVAMLLMAYHTATSSTGNAQGPPTESLADD